MYSFCNSSTKSFLPTQAVFFSCGYLCTNSSSVRGMLRFRRDCTRLLMYTWLLFLSWKRLQFSNMSPKSSSEKNLPPALSFLRAAMSPTLISSGFFEITSTITSLKRASMLLLCSSCWISPSCCSCSGDWNLALLSRMYCSRYCFEEKDIGYRSRYTKMTSKGQLSCLIFEIYHAWRQVRTFRAMLMARRPNSILAFWRLNSLIFWTAAGMDFSSVPTSLASEVMYSSTRGSMIQNHFCITQFLPKGISTGPDTRGTPWAVVVTLRMNTRSDTA